MQLKGKSALITGAAAGIGRATAIAFAERGLRHVALCDLDEAGLEETARLVRQHGASAEVFRVDVTDTEVLRKALVETHKAHGLDVVFNNAGIVSGPPAFPETPIARVKLLIDINLTSVIMGTMLAIDLMKGSGGGVIINTASTGALSPYLADAPYAASKAAVLMFSQSCKDLNAMHNIRVNAILPGITETPILEKLGAGKRPDWLQPLMQNVRLWKPEEIARQIIEELIEDDSKAGDYAVARNEPLTA